MSHPTKFRVWSKQASKWMSNIVINDVGTPILLYSEKKGKKVEHNVFLIDNYEPVVQWSTGLKDKNEVEIYDGDILKHEGGLTYTVSYDNSAWNVTTDTLGIGLLIETNYDQSQVIDNILERAARTDSAPQQKAAALTTEITSIESVQSPEPKDANDAV